MSQQSVNTSTPEPSVSSNAVEGLSAAEKKRQKNKKKKDRQKQKRKELKPFSTEELPLEASSTPETPILEDTLAPQVEDKAAESSQDPDTPAPSTAIETSYASNSAPIADPQEGTITETLPHTQDVITEPSQQQEVLGGPHVEEDHLSAPPVVADLEPQDLFDSQDKSENLLWDQQKTEGNDTFKVNVEGQGCYESSAVEAIVHEQTTALTATNALETEVNTESVLDEPVVEAKEDTFASNGQSSLPWEQPKNEEEVRTQQTEEIETQKAPVSCQSEPETAQDLFAQSGTENLPWEDNSQNVLQILSGTTPGELFRGADQSDLPKESKSEPEQPKNDIFVHVGLNMGSNPAPATVEVIPAEAVDSFSPSGKLGALAWDSATKSESSPVKELEREVAPAASTEASFETGNEANQLPNDDLFGASEECDFMASLGNPTSELATTEPKTIAIEDRLDELFGASNDDSWSTALKQDVQEEAKPERKEKKFSFLDDDDLLDDNLLDDELLNDQPVEQQPQIQPQANVYHPQQSTQPAQPQQPSGNSYNPYGPPVTMTPQASQHHLDLKKLDENKKKSDAYDFPAELMPTKLVKSNRATPNPYVQLNTSQLPIPGPVFHQSPNVNHSSMQLPPAGLSHQPSRNSLSTSQYTPPAAPLEVPKSNAYAPSIVASQPSKTNSYGLPTTDSQPSQHHLDLKKLNEMKKKSDAYDFPADLIPNKPGSASLGHARAARSVSVASSGASPKPTQAYGINPPPNPYATNGSGPHPAGKPPVGNRYRVTSIGSNVSNSSFAPLQQQKQSGPLPLIPSPNFNSFSSAIPFGLQGNQLQPAVPQGSYGQPQFNQHPQPIQQPFPPQGHQLPTTGLGLQQGQPPNAYSQPGSGFQLDQRPVANPQLSPLLTQVGHNRYGAPNLSVPSQNMPSINSTLDTVKSPSLATPSPSASKYAPINHRRKASATANQYDPYSLTKLQQQNQSHKPGQRLSTIQQGALNQDVASSAGFLQPPAQHQGPPIQQQQRYVQPPVPHQQPYQQHWGGQGHHQQAIPLHLNPEQLTSRQFPLFSWSHSDKLAYFVPGVGYQANHGIKVVTTDSVLQEAILKEFPGATKRNTPTIITFLDKQLERLATSRSSAAEEDELLLVQLLKHKLSKSTEIFALGGIISYNEGSQQQSAFREKRLHQTQPLSERQLVGLISSGQNEQAVSLALQHDNYALALVVSGVIGKDAWIGIVSKYLEHEFKGDQDKFLHTLITVLAGDFSEVIKSFNRDGNRKQWALRHWREFAAAVVANKPVFLNQFLTEFGTFLAENGLVTASYVLFVTGELPMSSQIFKPVTLRLTIYLEVYALILQEKGVNTDLTEFYLKHASWLIDYNLLGEAQKYVDLAASSLKISKTATLPAKYTFSLLSDKLSGSTITDGSWFGRPKLDKVWGQLDKSLNKFISGDDLTKGPTKEGVFSKFSPNISRASSFVSIPNATANCTLDSRLPPPPTNQGNQGSLPYGLQRSQSYAPQSGPINPPLRSYTPSIPNLQQADQKTHPSQEEHSSPSPGFPPPPKFKAGRPSLNNSPRAKSSRYAVSDQLSRRSSTQSHGSSVNEELQIKPNVPHSSHQYGASSSSLTNSALPKVPQFTTGNHYAPSTASSTVSDLPPLNNYGAPPLKAPSKLYTVSTEADIETTRDSVEDLGSTLSKVDLEEKVQGQVQDLTQTQAPAAQQLAQQPSLVEAMLPTSPKPQAHSTAQDWAPASVHPEEETIAEATITAEEMSTIDQVNSSNVTGQNSGNFEINRQEQEVSPMIEAYIATPDVAYENPAETNSAVTSQEVSEFQTQTQTDTLPKPEFSEEIDNEDDIKDGDGGLNYSKMNKSTSDFGSTTVTPYLGPTEFQVQHNIPEELKENLIESAFSKPAPPLGPPPRRNTYAPIINGAPRPKRSTSASRFAPKSYDPVDTSVKESTVVPLAQEVDFNATNGQERREVVELPTGVEAAKEIDSKLEAPVETYVVNSPAVSDPPPAKNFSSRKSSVGQPINPYAPSASTPTVSRKNSYHPSNSYGPSTKGLKTPDQSKFGPYQPNASETNTLNSLVDSSYDKPTGQTSNFEDFKPPDAISLIPNDPGSPSARKADYRPPLTEHNITNIAEVVEEYYDDVVDESDDDDEDDEIPKKGGQKEEEVEDKSENKKSKKSKEEGGSGWFTWLRKDNKNEPKVYRAKLGEQNNFYFDKELNRWVNKNAPEEAQKAATPPPPPPIIKKKPSNLSKPRSDSITEPSTSGSASFPTSGPPKPPGPGPASVPSSAARRPVISDLDSLINMSGPPTAVSRRKKRGGRGYVDVMGSLQDKK